MPKSGLNKRAPAGEQAIPGAGGGVNGAAAARPQAAGSGPAPAAGAADDQEIFVDPMMGGPLGFWVEDQCVDANKIVELITVRPLL
jgi:hypothetical protein